MADQFPVVRCLFCNSSGHGWAEITTADAFSFFLNIHTEFIYAIFIRVDTSVLIAALLMWFNYPLTPLEIIP